jgi:hypothetical protein
MRAILGEIAQRSRGLKSLTKTGIGKWEDGLLSDSQFLVNTVFTGKPPEIIKNSRKLADSFAKP